MSFVLHTLLDQLMLLLCLLYSDIDDTMLAALFDTRYPELTVYPGVHQFAQELLRRSAMIASDYADQQCGYEQDDSDSDTDLEAGTTDRFKKPKKMQRVAFLTARPEVLRKRSLQELRACGFQHFTRTECLCIALRDLYMRMLMWYL